MRADSSHDRVCSLVAPMSLALIVVLACSVDRAGLGGAGAGGMAGDVAGAAGSGGGLAGALGAGGALGAAGALAGMTGNDADSGGPPEDAGDPPDLSPSDAPPTMIGCADGTREAFNDETRFPSIAGCAGGWSVPGLLTDQSMTPACARGAGDDSSNPGGIGCTVEDLCADGWHVCRGASELTLAGVTCQDAGIAPTTGGGGAMFFATRQHGTAPTGCSPDATTGNNNVHGCGNFGRVEDPGCAPPLNRQIESTVCAANPPWSCSDPTSIMTEATVVTKSGSPGGGVLCCR